VQETEGVMRAFAVSKLVHPDKVLQACGCLNQRESRIWATSLVSCAPELSQ